MGYGLEFRAWIAQTWKHTMNWISFSGLRYERYEKHTLVSFVLSSWTSAVLFISSPSRFSWGVGQRTFHLVVLKVMISRFIGSLASVHIRKSLELSISRQNNMLSAYLESKEPVNMHTRHSQRIYWPARDFTLMHITTAMSL